MIRSAFIKYSLQLRIGRCADQSQSSLCFGLWLSRALYCLRSWLKRALYFLVRYTCCAHNLQTLGCLLCGARSMTVFTVSSHRMHGAFVTYHNTQEIFGFQYVPLKYMDRTVYGNSHMANTHFDTAAKILSHILHTVSSDHILSHILRNVSSDEETCCMLKRLRVMRPWHLWHVCGMLDHALFAPCACLPVEMEFHVGRVGMLLGRC